MADSDTNTQEIQNAIRRRFWVRVRPAETGCWLWVGGVRSNGYGTFAVRHAATRAWTQTTAHRFAYQDMVGAVPDGYEVDHLCRIRNCVRPDHLEATTVLENRHRRDAGTVFSVPVDYQPLPVVPPKPVKPRKPRPPRGPAPSPIKKGPLLFCSNGHEYAIVGKVINGFRKDTGQRIYTCAACRNLQTARKRKGNYASTRTHCPQGHPYAGENLWERTKYKNGRPYNARECRACVRERNRLASKARA